MTNFDRLHHMSKVELAQELEKIRSASALPYADFMEWLGSSDAIIRPRGYKVRATVYTRHNQTRKIIDLSEMVCIVISDDVRMFGNRYYSVWDAETQTIKSIPFDCFEIDEVLWNE